MSIVSPTKIRVVGEARTQSVYEGITTTVNCSRLLWECDTASEPTWSQPPDTGAFVATFHMVLSTLCSTGEET